MVQLDVPSELFHPVTTPAPFTPAPVIQEFQCLRVQERAAVREWSGAYEILDKKAAIFFPSIRNLITASNHHLTHTVISFIHFHGKIPVAFGFVINGTAFIPGK